MNAHEKFDEITAASAKELAEMFRSGDLSPVEVAEACLLQAETTGVELNAFTHIARTSALATAQASERRWKEGAPLSALDGVPTTIKDIVHTKGMDVRYGSNTTSDVSKLEDSPCVARLRQAGAVFLGLTNTPELGWKAVTDSPRNGITRNPWNPDLTPGGSSGGAAVAAAIGAGTLHIGTDGGGSIRIPAAFTGIVGHKPSYGRVPARPLSVFGTVAHIGPMARTVDDCISMLEVMAGADPCDWTQRGTAPFKPVLTPVKPLRIGYWKTAPVGHTDPQIASAVESALRDFEAAGSIVEEVSLPVGGALLDMFHKHWFVGAAARLDGLAGADTSQMDPGFVRIAKQGLEMSAVDRANAEIARAQFGAAMEDLLGAYDVIISPSVTVLPFTAGHEVPENSEMECWTEWAGFNFPINLSQQPACSVPCGRTRDGLPIGLQIVGARDDDATVLAAALYWQEMHPEFFIRNHNDLPNSKAARQ